jgi:hypothetical protein
VDQILRLSTQIRYVRKRFLEVQSMLKPPAVLFKPDIVARVLGRILKDAFGKAVTRSRKIADSQPFPELSVKFIC